MSLVEGDYWDRWSDMRSIELTDREERAWQRYCMESRGAMSAADFWWELPKGVQDHYLERADVWHG